MNDHEPAVQGDVRPRWSRLAALGLFLAGLGPLLYVITSVAWGLDTSSNVPFFGVAVVVGWLGAFLVLRYGTWARWVGIVAAVLLVLA
ncbi:MAG TPA: hypothetical protein VKA30_04440, partial [Actinomycetota bacterium]|nr:hypothetical protein [Actinomycetota bacterium]